LLQWFFLIDSLIQWSIHWFIASLIRWFIGLLIHWFID
jgi:hypothetical protein